MPSFNQKQEKTVAIPPVPPTRKILRVGFTFPGISKTCQFNKILNQVKAMQQESQKTELLTRVDNLYVQLVIRTENPPVTDGISWRVLKGHAISQSFHVEGIDCEDQIRRGASTYQKPDEANYRLVASESGGGLTHRGSATIICGLRGEPLIPFFTPKGYANGVHANFSGSGFVIVNATRDNDTRHVTIKLITINEHSGLIWADLLWEGDIDKIGFKGWETSITLNQLPNKVGAYYMAIVAACEKSGCYHCRHVHFVGEKASNGKVNKND